MDNRKKIEIFRKRVKQIINEADPWYLLEIGAPDDEYDSWIDTTVSFIINSKPSLDQLKTRLIEIFSTSEYELDKNKINSMAEDLSKLDLEVAFLERVN